MSFGPLLLRVMLILAFVLNGTTSAMAAAQMSLGHPMPQGEAMQHAPEPAHHEAMSACHSDAAETDGEASHESAFQPASHHEDPSDCCDGGSCLCVCAHGMHATVPVPAAAMHVYGRIDEADVPAIGHAAPALPHLIRPPIG